MSNTYTFVAGSDGKPVRLGYPIRQLTQKDIDGANANERPDLAVNDVLYQLIGDTVTLYGWNFATRQLEPQTPAMLADLSSPNPIGDVEPNTGVFTSLRFRNIANTFSGLFQSMITVARTWTFPDKDGTVAMLDDVPVAETGATIRGKLGITTLSGANTGNETPVTLGALINGATAKTTPVDADMTAVMDSAASNVAKKLSWANIKATLKTYFDTLYAAFNLAQNSQSSAYTFVLSDNNKQVFHPASDTTARTWTIPANAATAFPIGTCITVINETAAGVLTIAITTDTLRLAGGASGSRTLAPNGLMTLIKISATVWMCSGVGLS